MNADEVEASTDNDVDHEPRRDEVDPGSTTPSAGTDTRTPHAPSPPEPSSAPAPGDPTTAGVAVTPALVASVVPAAAISGAAAPAPAAASAPMLAAVASPGTHAQAGTADAALASSANTETTPPESDIAFVAPDELAALAERIHGSHGESVQSEKATPAPAENVAQPQSAREITPRAREAVPEAQRFLPHDETVSEILKQVRLKLSPELRQATLSLAPPELGRISIRLSLEDRRLTAWVRGEKVETLELLGKHLPELRATLAAHGIEAEHFELALGFQDRERSHGEPSRSSPNSSTSVARTEAPSETVELAPLARALAAANGVDTFA
ncbi:MAG: flagellar hook-length control protein FliK [Planctomycetota bacterium]